ncbi:putative RNA-directed DNA polymerase, partial [Operophtera brumata]
KTDYICFTIYNRTQPDPVFNIKIHKCDLISQYCDCSEIKKVENTKYLGVIIDQRLTWHGQLEQLKKTNMDLKKIETCCSSYCTHIPIWGGATKTHFLDLERAQRSLLKVMYSTEILYSDADIISVRKFYVLNSLLKQHKTLNMTQPN